MRADNFNEVAMEEKIRKNLPKFGIKGIHLALMEEYRDILEKIRPLQIRAIELSDQLDYMREKHPIPKEEGNDEKLA